MNTMLIALLYLRPGVPSQLAELQLLYNPAHVDDYIMYVDVLQLILF